MPNPENRPAKSEEKLFSAALDLPPALRQAFLDQACGDNAGLLRRLAALLKAHEEAGDLLEPPRVDLSDPADPTPSTDDPTALGFVQQISDGPGDAENRRCSPWHMWDAAVCRGMEFFRAWRFACLLAVGLGFSAPSARAQWQTQSFLLKPGWNAVYLHVDASYQTLDELIQNTNGPIREIWLWKPRVSTMQFIDSPVPTNSTPNSQWALWTNDRTDRSDTLTRLSANAAYLVYNRTGTNYPWTVTGKPVPPSYRWTTTGLNFIGFPTPANAAPNFGTYFAPAPGLNLADRNLNGVRLFGYPGGELGQTNPVEFTATTSLVNRGEAFWVRGSSNYYNRYYGPVEVSLQNAAGIHYGDNLGTYSVRLKNLTATNRTVTFTLLPSEPRPTTTEPDIKGTPPLLVRGTLNNTTLTYDHTVLAGSQSFQLKAQGLDGSELEVVLGLNRAALLTNSFYAGILRIEDDARLQQIDVPVSATVPNASGLWVGQANVDRVGEYLKQYPKSTNTTTTNAVVRINEVVATLRGQPANGAEFPGSEWTARETVRNYTASAMALNGSRVFAAVSGGNILTSTDLFSTNSTVTFQARGPAQAKAWGDTASGQTIIPVGLAYASALAAGDGFSVATKADGTVVAWGANGSGQANVPAGLSGVTAISASYYHVLALKGDGTVVAWGDNGGGRATVPAGLSGVTAVAAGLDHSLALKGDGTVVAWGGNGSGQTTVPSGLSGVTAVAANQNFSLALKGDGTVVAWGANTFGQTTVPGGLSGVRAIAAAWNHSVALKSDGTVVAWGYNGGHQTDVPAGLSGVTAIAANGGYTLALKYDGTVVAWGDNDKAQATVPATLGSCIGIAAGARHAVARVLMNQNYSALACSADGSVVAAGVTSNPLLISLDSGMTWRSVPGVTGCSDITCSADGQKLAAIAGDRVYTSSDQGQTWTARDTNRNWKGIASSADGTRLLASAYNSFLFTSTNSGVTWMSNAVPSATAAWGKVAASANGSNLVAVMDSGQIYTSTNGGANWDAREASRSWKAIASSTDGQRLVATAANGLIYLSRDAGLTWEARATIQNWISVASSGDATRLMALVSGGRMFSLNRRFADYVLDPESGLVRNQDGRYLSSGIITNMARVANPLPLRLIVHFNAVTSTATLLQRVYVGTGLGTNTVVANREQSLNPTNLATARRISATHLPFTLNNTVWSAAGGGFTAGSSVGFSVRLDFNDQASNPFLHTFHPDHDNLDETFKLVARVGKESYTVTRDIKLSFSPAGTTFTALTGSQQTRAGVYEESITVEALDSATRVFKLSGSFSLQRISPVPTLTLQ